MSTLVAFTRPPCPEVVEYLEEQLERARKGDMTGVLMVSQDGNGDVWYTVAGIKDRMTVLGVLSHAMHKLQTD